MQPVEDKNINIGIAQIISIFERPDEKCIEWYLQNVKNINQRVLATNYLETNKPEFINNTALQLAFIDGNKKAFKVLLKFNSDFTLRNLNGSTIIHQVIQQSCMDYHNIWKLNGRLQNYFVDAVLSAHIQFENPANPCDNNGISHFHAACMSNNVEAVEFFLKNGVSVNQAVHASSSVLPGYSPLHFAVRCSNLEVIIVLLNYGANVNLQDTNGVTPFYMLIEQKMEIVEKKYGIIKQEFINNEKEHQEIITNNELIICHLIRDRKDKNEQNVDNNKVSFLKDFVKRDEAMAGKNKFVELLLKHHHKVTNHADKQGLSKLHIACTRIGSKSLIEKSLSSASDVNIVYRGKSLSLIHENSTPLHIALYNKNYEAAMLLLTHGADVFAKDINNLTPLHHLLDNSHVIPESIYEILFSNSDLQNNLYEKTGLDLMHIACASYSLNLFPLLRLLKSGATVNRKFKCTDQSFYKQFANFTPLQFAINIGSTKIADLLISRGANLFLEKPMFFKKFSESYAGYLENLVMETKQATILQRFEKDLNLTLLHVACYNIDVEKIKDLLKMDSNVNAKIVCNSPIWPGSTPLHVLLYRYFNKHENTSTQQNLLFGLLIGKGADVTLTNAVESSPLHMAFNLFNQGKLQFSQLSKILKSQKNFDVNPMNNESISHLYIACVLGDTTMMKKFLDHGANANEGADIFSSGYPSLLHAVLNSRKVSDVCDENSLKSSKAVHLLLEHGVDVAVVDREGNTPLHLIAENCQPSARESLVEKMIDGGCDGTARNLKGESAFEIILRKHNCSVKELESFLKQIDYLNVFNPITEEGLIGLIFANPNLCEIVFNLIENKPPIAKTDDMGRTVIHNIFSVDEHVFHKQHFYLDCAKIVNCDINDQDKLGRTALHFVSKSYGGLAVSDLLAAGANANIVDAKGELKAEQLYLNGHLTVPLTFICNMLGFAPLHIVLQHKNTEAASALLNGGADANIIDATGNAPLHIAIRQEMIEAIHALLKSGADANIVGAHGNTPLHIAAQWSNIKLIAALLKSGANIDSKDDGGKTPLFHATLLLKNKAVNELLWFGADITIKDIKGKSSVDYARIYYDPEVTKTFANHIHKLKHCGIKLTRLKVDLNSFLLEACPSKTFEQQFEETKNVIIEPYSLTLYDYFSKIDEMVENPYESQFKCYAIKEFFKFNENKEFLEKNSEMMPILNLLNRKALKVLEFIEQNRVSLNKIVGFPLPDLCFQAILKYLDITSMKNLIHSTAALNALDCTSHE